MKRKVFSLFLFSEKAWLPVVWRGTLLWCLFLSMSLPVGAQEPLKLWYDKPAGEWVEALPLGNGHIGAMVYGGVIEELIQLNESSLWSVALARTV